MKKLLKIMTVGLFCAVSLVANAETGESSLTKSHQAWASFRLCYDVCVCRATTANDSMKSAFHLDFFDDGYYEIGMFIYDIPIPAIKLWNKTSDRIRVDVRVDRKTLYTYDIDRTLDKPTRTLYFKLPAKYLGSKFIKELTSGKTLRIRTHVNDEATITSFKLNGATDAIKRAEVESERQQRKDNLSSEQKKKDESYFENNNSNDSNDDTTYF